MRQEILNLDDELNSKGISPFLEMGAYEALWSEDKASFKKIADRFRDRPGAKLSDFVEPSVAEETARRIYAMFFEAGVKEFGVQTRQSMEYRAKLRDAQHPVELLYYQGIWNWTESRSVAVVGTRKPSELGVKRTQKLARLLVANDFTVVSGLAAGVDTAAHEAAIAAGGATIAVIGTPLGNAYPKDNAALQARIAKEYLVISQVPIFRYSQRDWRWNRGFFPERNVTMSALTEATVIVEAGNTSGTLIQARAALRQGRKLFILNNCFEDSSLTWPARLQKQGAIRIRDFNEILAHLNDAKPSEN